MKTILGVTLLVAAACAEAAPPPPSRPEAASAERSAVPASTIQTQAPADVSGDRAFEHLKQLVAIGPRPAGSPGMLQMRAYITKQMGALGLTVKEQAFMATTPVGQVPMANLIVTLPGKRPERILITSHYDTKPFTDIVFVGANDAGSSTALLMELARVLKDRPREYTYELVFFDGEEAWGEWATGNTWGSRYYVEAAKKAGTLGSIKAMILLDMIGERGVQLLQDTNSTRWLNEIFWRTAGRLGHAATFVPSITTVEDDHIPFRNAGVPVIDLIDLDYPAWHTAGDTIDKTDSRSLKIVGDVVVAALPEVEKHLSGGR